MLDQDFVVHGAAHNEAALPGGVAENADNAADGEMENAIFLEESTDIAVFCEDHLVLRIGIPRREKSAKCFARFTRFWQFHDKGTHRTVALFHFSVRHDKGMVLSAPVRHRWNAEHQSMLGRLLDRRGELGFSSFMTFALFPAVVPEK
jgi:hypothetical protein